MGSTYMIYQWNGNDTIKMIRLDFVNHNTNISDPW